jgi:DNA polymerase V
MIGLMDCNNFFVSCERLFRPDLVGKPVAVLSANDGCVVARSKEVKDLGIPMGVSLFQIEDLCKKHNIVLFSSNFDLYHDISSRVMRALRDEVGECEIYSIDEAFFGGEEITKIDPRTIRENIIKKTGIPVSVGISETKTLAKIANGQAKKGNGICILNQSAWRKLASEISCGSVWGIGKSMTEALQRHNIRTVNQFCELPLPVVRRLFGVVGERIHMELSGVPAHYRGNEVGGGQKSYSSTHSFKGHIKDIHVLESALAYHAQEVSHKMQKDGYVCSQLTIIMSGSRFGDFSHRKGSLSVALVVPTNGVFEIVDEVLKLSKKLFDPVVPYKKVGIVASCAVPSDVAPQTLFGSQDIHVELSCLEKELHKKFGKGSVRSGVMFSRKVGHENRENKSPNYTTQWSEIPKIKAV